MKANGEGIMKKTVDWIKVKTEYVTTGISQRKLAEKYGISFNTLKDRANREKWNDEKNIARNKITTDTQRKTIDVIVDKEVDRITRILELTDRLSDKVEQAIDELDKYLLKDKVKVKEVEYKDEMALGKPTKEIITEKEHIKVMKGNIDRLGLQQVANALKAIKDINVDIKRGDEEIVEDDGLLTALSASVDITIDDDSDFLPDEEAED